MRIMKSLFAIAQISYGWNFSQCDDHNEFFKMERARILCRWTSRSETWEGLYCNCYCMSEEAWKRNGNRTAEGWGDINRLVAIDAGLE